MDAQFAYCTNRCFVAVGLMLRYVVNKWDFPIYIVHFSWWLTFDDNDHVYHTSSSQRFNRLSKQ